MWLVCEGRARGVVLLKPGDIVCESRAGRLLLVLSYSIVVEDP